MRISDWSSDVCSSDLYAGFDPVCCEKLVLRSPLGIGNDHVLGDQLDVDGCEIKLKIASYVDLPFKIGRNDGLERVLQEPSLGDKQYRPDTHDQRQQACNKSKWPTNIPSQMRRLFMPSHIPIYQK